MSLTLLVENNPKIESFYSLNLNTWLGLETASKDSSESAIKFLTEHPETRLIIVRAKIGKDQAAKTLLEFRAKNNLKIPIIILGGGKEFAGELQVANSLDLRPVIKMSASALGITAKEMSTKVVPDFYPIPLSVFTTLKKTLTNVFQQVGGHFEILFEKNSAISQDFIFKITRSGVHTVYVDKLDRLEFVNNASLELLASLEVEKLDPDEQITVIDKGVELLAGKLISIGVTQETITLANRNMGLIRDQVRKYPNLSHLVVRLQENKSSYLYLHTQILTYVSVHIIKNIDWGTQEQEDKISFIAFFHDILLENDEQAVIKSNTQLKLSKLPPEKKLLVEKHAQMAGEIVSKFPHAPMSADQIIRQHHGQLNGLGFSEHYGANISPIAIVFIVAEEFTRIILKRELGPFNRNDMLRELKAEFPTMRFNKILDLLTNITF